MTDTVDDLHAAEDFAGACIATLRELVVISSKVPLGRLAVISELHRISSDAAMLTERWDSYCRPSCNPNDDGPHDEVCDEGPTCGCPCRDRAEANS